MIKITSLIAFSESELKFTFIRAPGPGGQNVNKVATAVLLRFNVLKTSQLPENVRTLLLASNKITLQGDLIIKASRFRTQERNKKDAIQRLREIIKRAAIVPKKRRKTKPTHASIQRRLDTKKRHAKIKSGRRSKTILND